MMALLHRLSAFHRAHRKAFTALEVLLVVTLVFVVAVIGFPSVQDAKPRSSMRAVAMQLAEDMRLARQTAIAKNMPVGVLFSNENGTKAVTRGYYFMEGHTDPKVTKVVDYSRTNAEACIFIGYWRLGDPTKTTSVTEPAISAHAKNFSMTSWNGASKDYAFVFLPSGVTKTNDLPHFDGAYHIVVAKAVDAATRSSAELPGDFLLTALTAMASPSPYYELSGVWTPAYTVNVTPLGDITVGEGVTGIDPTFIMNTPMPAVAAGATLPAVWSGVNTAPAVAPSDFVIYPPPNTATLPAGIDAFVRRDKHINFLVKATDAQGDIAYCQWSDSLASGSGPPNGTFSVTGEVEMEWSEADGKYISSVQWTPPPNAVGRDEYTITLTLRDRNGGTTPLSRKVKIMEGRIVFSSNRDGNYDIYVMNADGTDQTQLTSDSTQNYNPVFSPDGAKIAYLVDAGGNWQIVVMNADGTGKTQLATSSDQRSYPLFSPDGTKITYHDMVGGYNQIIVMNADGTGRMQFTAGNDHHELPVFSQNGTKITYYALVGGDYQVFVMNADGTGKTQLTTDSNQNVWPVFSPDGMKIAYHARVGGVGGHNQIFVMNADGTGQTQLTTSSTHHELPVFTPEGTRIIYLAAAGGYWQIFMMNADGTGQTQLTTASSRAYPSFSPDGTKIAFYAEAGGHNQIFVMNADGTGQTQLTSGHDCHLCLRPGIWLR